MRLSLNLWNNGTTDHRNDGHYLPPDNVPSTISVMSKFPFDGNDDNKQSNKCKSTPIIALMVSAPVGKLAELVINDTKRGPPKIRFLSDPT
jgi:hypothetical protein